MAELTIDLDEETLERARARAQERGTSVEALLCEYLESYVAGSGPVGSEPSEAQRRAVKDLLDLAAEMTGGGGGRQWTREGLYQ